MRLRRGTRGESGPEPDATNFKIKRHANRLYSSPSSAAVNATLANSISLSSTSAAS